MDFKINPCLKNYNLDKNNVCDLCQKRILREEELANIDLNCTDDEICVITTSKRVNTNYILHPFRVFGFSVLVVFGSSLFSLNANAQDTINMIQKSMVTEQQIDQNLFSISGIVVDEDNEPIPFVNVFIPYEESYLTGTTTDFDGKFTLKFDPNKIKTDSFVVKLSSVEFSSVEIEFSRSDISKNIDAGKFELKINTVEMEEHFMMLGFYVPSEPPMDKDPNAHRSTKIGREELKRSPYRD